MKKIAYSALAASTFYFALFVTIPLTSYVLAYIIALYFIITILGSLRIITKDEKDTEYIHMSVEEMDSIKIAKEANLDITKLLSSGMAMVKARKDMDLEDGNYKMILINENQKELIEKIFAVINSQKEDCK